MSEMYMDMNMDLSFINHALTNITNILTNISNNIQNSFNNINPIGRGQSKGNNPMMGLTKGLGGMFKPLLGMFGKVLAPMMLIGALIKGILEPFQMILEPIEAIGEIIGTIFYPILQPFLDKMWELVDWISDMMAIIEPFYPEIERVIGLVLDFLMNILSDKVMLIFAQIKAFFDFIWGVIGDLIAVFKGDLSIGEFFARLWERVKILVAELWDNLISWLRSLWVRIMDVLGELGEKMVNWFKNLWDNIVSGVGGGVEKARDWWSGVGEDIKEGWDKFWSW